MPASSLVAWAGSPAIGVTRVTRVTEPDRTNVSATSRADIAATPDLAPGCQGCSRRFPRGGCNSGNPHIDLWGSPD